MAVKIPLGKGKYALVDAEDFDWLSQSKWHLSVTGYAVRTLERRKKIYMHREVNQTPTDKFTDHVNGDRLDNRKSNLRTCYRSGNAMNLKKSKGASGFIGVYATGKNWRARVKVDGVMRHLGSFPAPALAAEARISFVDKHIKAGN